MASQVNSQFAYINLINGDTVWERLRIVRNFLEDRNAALAMKPVGELKRQAILARIEEAEKPSQKLDAQAELVEFDAMQATQIDGYKKLDDELVFLKQYEAMLANLAEESRVEGKTDDEMYQINMPNEVYVRNLRKIEAEQIVRALGISQATAEESMRIPVMRKQLLARAQLLLTPQETEEFKALSTQSLDLNEIPPSVQEQLKLNNLFLLT